MFDPQKAEPIFLEIVKRMSAEAVTVLGEGIRQLIAGDFAGANSIIVAGRRQMSPIEPAQKPLAALHQNILVHNRLHELGTPIPIDRIWAKSDPASRAPTREATVSHDTQAALLFEMKHQLSRGSAANAPCPGCGADDCVHVGTARLVRSDDTVSTQGQKYRALTRFLDPKPLVAILGTDVANYGADVDTTMRIVLMLAMRENLAVPVARCGSCSLAFVAYQMRAPEPVPALDVAQAVRHGGAGTTFVEAFEQSLLPHLAWREGDLWAGASVFEFGCGSGSGLAHHATAGMKASGYEIDADATGYAREVFGLSEVSSDLNAGDDETVTCVISNGALERTPQLGEVLDSLCRKVAKNGSILLVGRDGETSASADSAAGVEFPHLSGRYLTALTPDYLSGQLSKRGLEVMRKFKSPARLEDPRFPLDRRDPFTGVPLWSPRPGDFVVFAKRT